MRQSYAATGGEGWESFFRGATPMYYTEEAKLLKMLPAEVAELDCRDTQYMLH